VNLSSRLVATPITTPIAKLPKKTNKKTPIDSNKLRIVSLPAAAPGLYFCAVSNSTIAIASFRIDSPKMIVYSFGSTLYVLKIARIVTGSVALSVAPTLIASTKLMFRPSIGMRVYRYNITPSTSAEMNVPAKAKVRIVPMLRKKLACVHCQYIPRSPSQLFPAPTWCSSYPLARIIGGSNKLKKVW